MLNNIKSTVHLCIVYIVLGAVMCPGDFQILNWVCKQRFYTVYFSLVNGNLPYVTLYLWQVYCKCFIASSPDISFMLNSQLTSGTLHSLWPAK